jgi:predicted Zn finger-like uncharacterized protein
MRLICPTCNAQYEVADNVIPEGGRDVQCSSCGTTWFQKPVSDIRPASKPVVAPRRPVQQDEPRWQAETQDATPPRPVPRVSDDAASILREEAMRELKARLSERPAVETQADFGLMPPIETPRRPRPEPVEAEAPTPTPPAAAAPAPRPAPERPAPAAQAPTPAPAPAPAPTGRNRLPDIEEVAATHSARAGATGGVANAQQAAYRRSFRLGFGVSLVAGLAAFAAYVYAPQISARLPAAAPALAAYVAKADILRGKLDVLVKNTLGATPGA